MASLEASPIPLPVSGAVPDLSGYGLVVVYASSPEAPRVVAEAVREGVNVLVVLDAEGRLTPRGAEVVEVGEAVDVLLVRVEGGAPRQYAARNVSPGYALVVEEPEVLGRARGVGFPAELAPGEGLLVTYLELDVAGVTLAFASPGLVEFLRESGVLDDLSSGGPVLIVPPRGLQPLAAVFHPATVLWTAVGLAEELREGMERQPLYRASLALLAVAVSLLGLLPALSALTEPAEAGRGRGRPWTLRGLLSSLRGS